MRPTNSLEANRDLSRRLVFDQIRQHGKITRAEIVRATGLSKATVSSIVSNLLAAGLVRETGSVSGAIGRPRILLQLMPDACLAVGAELDNDQCRVVLTNIRAEPLVRAAMPVDDLSVNGILRPLEIAVNRIVQGLDPSRIAGIGVTVPGYIDPLSGRVIRSVVLGWSDISLREELLQRFPWPRLGIFARGHAAAWGEYQHGAGRGVSNLIYLRAGTGIALGMVLNGEAYLGKHYGAGEIGHTTVQPNGELCSCGHRGCLETVASIKALIRRTRQLLVHEPENTLWRTLRKDQAQLDLPTLITAARQGNPLAVQVLAKGGRWLGLALSSVVNLLTPEMLIFGGPLAQAGALVIDPLYDELALRALPTSVANTKLVLSTLKEDAPSIGAASLVLREFTAPVQALTMLPLVKTGGSLFDRR